MRHYDADEVKVSGNNWVTSIATSICCECLATKVYNVTFDVYGY